MQVYGSAKVKGYISRIVLPITKVAIAGKVRTDATLL